MTAPAVLKVAEAQLKQCPLRGAMVCSGPACMAWLSVTKDTGRCALLVEPKQ